MTARLLINSIDTRTFITNPIMQYYTVRECKKGPFFLFFAEIYKTLKGTREVNFSYQGAWGMEFAQICLKFTHKLSIFRFDHFKEGSAKRYDRICAFGQKREIFNVKNLA